MTLDSLRSLYVHELQDLHSAETQLVKALPKLAKAATAPELKSAFTNHLAQTKEHVQRLEQLLSSLGQEPGGQRCKGMAGLIKEGQDLIKEAKSGAADGVLDTGLITAAQKVEHYEMAGYSAAQTYARMLKDDSAADVLDQTLKEESRTDEELAELAQAVASVASQAPRLDDIDMHGDAPGARDQPPHGGTQPVPGDEDVDTYKGATEEPDNDAPRNWPDESSGPGARWQPGEEPRGDRMTEGKHEPHN